MTKVIETKKKVFTYKLGKDAEATGHEAEFRGLSANFLPSKLNLKEKNATFDYLLQNLVPSNKIIGKDDIITAFGSCFAREIIKFVKSKGYKTGELQPDITNFQDSHILQFSEGIVNTFSLLQQFEWAYDGKMFPQDLWFAKNGEAAPQTEDIRVKTKSILDFSTTFIITLGLSEIWYNKITGDACWRAVPIKKFDPDIYGFRVSTVEENKNNIVSIINIIRKYNPNAKIIFTLSPIPLLATFREIPCLVANSVSKAILRAALDEALSGFKTDDKLFYWPSYEIVKDYSLDPYKPDNRHLKRHVVDTIMSLFERYYLIPLNDKDRVQYKK